MEATLAVGNETELTVMPSATEADSVAKEATALAEEEEQVQVKEQKPRAEEDGKVNEVCELLPHKTLSLNCVNEAGESSVSSDDSAFICSICAESKAQNESLSAKDCSHSFCSECMIKHIVTRIQGGITSILCPEPSCKAVLELNQFTNSILPPQVFESWCHALCEAMIRRLQQFYCPYKDCSGLLVDEGDMVVKESECPYCHRLFCAQCKVSWHSGIDCEEYQQLNENERGKEDIMALELAKQSKWQRCPTCRFYVERTEGCLFIQCRCGASFCYNCGAPMLDHYCSNCKH
ncbi:hypothetical protein Sjap_012005 [Stephania japonica]|uniref:RBR-type E3 ubiquitin transferase n=1 Tax=Stephania japonica TaxID=461633 RepID=A0AAP0JCL1_9MAGN